MPSKYERKFLDDGTPNPKYKPRPAHWAKTGKSKGGRKKSLFEEGEFIFIDGEGGDYKGRHVYQMLSAGKGVGDEYTSQRIFREDGLSTKDCFNFLLDQRDRFPKGIFCIFAGGYDGNFWLKDLPREKIQAIVDANGKYYTWWNNYGIAFIQRKYFSLIYSGDKKPIKIWDVYGFFQSSFVGAVKTWLPGWHSLELIIKGKELRHNFTGSDYDFIVHYNDAELEAGVELMNRLRAGIEKLGMVITRWDGAGAIATAFYQYYGTKTAFSQPREEVLEACQYAYFGGRIEIGKIGRHAGTIYHYDVNSAYPAAQQDLPNLANGRWVNRGKNYDTRKTDNALTISLVRWDNIVNTAFCPFPYRSELQRKVLFPSHGKNWIWKPELDAALKWAEKYDYWKIELLDCWEFIPDNEKEKPFDFIPEKYRERQEMVSESKRTGIPNGAEKTTKLGLNSLYGKTCQKVGYDEKSGRKPPYHNLAYAGYITSKTRSLLFDAAMQSPYDIIALATDGIYSTKELKLNCPQEKILGAWERQTHDEMILVQAGFYFLREGEKLISYSRGFDKMGTQEEMQSTLKEILKAWAERRQEIYLPCTRFITLKSALISDDWWERWLTWHEFISEDGQKGRRLACYPTGTKRRMSDSKTRADKYMLQTMPEFNLCDIDHISEKHALPWDNSDGEAFNMDAVLEHGIESVD